MPKRDSIARGVRIKNDVVAAIEQRANRRKISFNSWMNWAIKIGLRSHSRSKR